MPFGPFQGSELLIILLILLLILGPSKIPALARGLGEAIREFKKAASGVEEARDMAVKEINEGLNARPVNSEFVKVEKKKEG